MAKNIDILLLFDIYGDMLTQKQRDFINCYYNDDLSLAEIAENEGITRQGVRDSIKRAESQLLDYEVHLGLSQKLKETRSYVDEILSLSDTISEINTHTILSREINDALARIRVVARMLSE